MNLNRNQFTRTVYNVMDFMGDIGGLFSALGLFFGSIVAVLQYRGMYMFITSQMVNTAAGTEVLSKSQDDGSADKLKLVKQERID